MNSMIKVTVVIPTYNRAHLIAESIQSALDQSFTDFEIVITDDGSTDNTKEVIDSFHDPRIRYFYQENQGVAVAANNCFEMARGEFIFFYSDDDVLMEGALEKAVSTLEKYPEAAFSYSQIYRMDESGRIFDMRKIKNRPTGVRRGADEIADYLIHGSRVPAMTILARRRCMFEVGLFDLSFRSGSEDCDLWIRMAKKYDVVYIAEPLVKCRKHATNIATARDMSEEETSKNRILEGIFNDTDMGHLWLPLRSRAYYYQHLRLARHAFDNRQMSLAREQLFKALKKNTGGLFNISWVALFVKSLIPLSLLSAIYKCKRYLQIKFHNMRGR